MTIAAVFQLGIAHQHLLSKQHHTRALSCGIMM